MKAKVLNANWTEETFKYHGHAAIRDFMVEVTNDLKEVQDFKELKLKAKINKALNTKRKVIYVNITEETFDLQYYRVFGCFDKKAKVETKVEEVKTEEIKEELDPWTTRFRV